VWNFESQGHAIVALASAFIIVQAQTARSIYTSKMSPPDKDKESNWLPDPKEKFILMMRLYWPKESVFSGFGNSSWEQYRE